MKTYMITAILILLLPLISAHGEEDFAMAESIIEAKTPCEDLTDEQLEIIGDYYMEQMHPGEAHERMDAMMGGESSESLEQMHINMARSFYCGEHQAVEGTPMQTMMGGGMMGPGMMYDTSQTPTNSWSPLSWLVFIAVAALLVAAIFWGTYSVMVKKK